MRVAGNGQEAIEVPAAAARYGPLVISGRERPIATWAEDTVSVAISVLGVAGMYWDSWRHNIKVIEDDNFWSPPHIALYTSLLVLMLWIGLIVIRRQQSRGIDLSAIPRGYGIGIVGLAMAGAGGVGDFIWHARFGFEDQVNAWWSPPHQVLFYGGVLLAAAPLISSWHRSGGALRVRAAVPVVLSLAVVTATATYALTHLSPLWNNVAPSDAFQDDIARLNDAYPPGELPDGHVGIDTAVRAFGDDAFPYYFYSLNQSVGALLLFAITLAAPVLLLLRRWRPPFGAVTVMFALYGLVTAIPTEFRDIEFVVGLVAGGLLVDIVIAWLRPEFSERPWQFRAVGAAVPLLSVSTYLITFELSKGLAWTISIWLGILITCTMIGLGLACLMAPPRTADE